MKLAMLAIVKNEHPEYLIEWRNHHAAMGVEHTYLLEHAPNEMPIPGMPDTTVWPTESARAQTTFYFRALKQIDAEWCIVVDCDEFVVCNDLLGLLNRAGAFANAVALNWLVFGSSGFENPVFPVHGSYRWRTEESNPINRHIKSIVRPRAVTRIASDPHYLCGGTVNEQGEKVAGPHHDYSGKIARVNHYYTRSKEDWAGKMARGRADGVGGWRTWVDFENINQDCIVNDPHPARIK